MNIAGWFKDSAAGLPRAARHHVHRARVRKGGGGWLGVGPVSALPAVARLLDVAGGAERAGGAVVAVEEERPLVRVAVPAQHQVHPAVFQDRVDVLAHLDEVRFGVRVVRALGVGGVVPVSDRPVGRVGGEIVLQPGGHGPGGRTAGGERVQADEVDVAVVEGVVGLRAGGDAACLAGGGHGVVEVVDRHATAGRRFVVAAGREQDGLAQHGGVDGEQVGLHLRVGGGAVGVVPQHEPEIRVPGAREAEIGVAHGGLRGAPGARIAQHPDPRGLGGPGAGSSEHEVVGVVSRQHGAGGPDGVEILRVGLKAGDTNLVFGGAGGVVDGAGEVADGRAVPHPAVAGRAGTPANRDRAGRTVLQVGPAGDGLGQGRQRRDRAEEDGHEEDGPRTHQWPGSANHGLSPCR